MAALNMRWRHGYVMCVTGIGDTVSAARRKAYGLIGKTIVPKMFYRNDIGMKFAEQDQTQLQKWGWLYEHPKEQPARSTSCIERVAN